MTKKSYNPSDAVITLIPEIERLYLKENMSKLQIGNQLGISSVTVGKVINDYLKIKRSYEPKGKVLELVQDIESLYCHEYKTKKEIATLLNISQEVVKRVLGEYLQITRDYTPSKKSLSKIDEIKRLYTEENLSASQVAIKLNMTTDTVLKIVDEHLNIKKSKSEISKESFKRQGQGFAEILHRKRMEYFHTHPEYGEKLSASQRGELNTVAKLNETKVIDIRAKYKTLISQGYRVTHAETKIAHDYDVGRSTISDIVKRRTWTHI